MIYVYEESTAQAYAEKYNRKFVALNETPEYMLGDVSGDETISIMDATLIQLYISSDITPTDIQLRAADTDQDGKIVVMDATAIQRYIAKIITEF